MITKNDLTGTWYNEQFKLIVGNEKISLNTNIETIHKPFYTKELYDEDIIWNEEDKIIKVSNNITLLKSSNIQHKIVISIDTDRVEMISLTKFEI